MSTFKSRIKKFANESLQKGVKIVRAALFADNVVCVEDDYRGGECEIIFCPDEWGFTTSNLKKTTSQMFIELNLDVLEGIAVWPRVRKIEEMFDVGKALLEPKKQDIWLVQPLISDQRIKLLLNP
jgi:hypothetical protein